MILNDYEIEFLAKKHKMIDPFQEGQVRQVEKAQQGMQKVISYGTTSFGYDVRLADEFKLFTSANCAIIDPKNFNEDIFVEKNGDSILIPPNSFILGRTVEYFIMPRDVFGMCLGKSTYARCGASVNVTPLEPGWEGHVTLEIANLTPLPIKVYAHEGISQFVFFKGSNCKTSYADRNGKYQWQKGVVPPRA